jgi:hypothetical protein
MYKIPVELQISCRKYFNDMRTDKEINKVLWWVNTDRTLFGENRIQFSPEIIVPHFKDSFKHSLSSRKEEYP